MYCRKCLVESKGEAKVNMDVNTEENFYECPECGSVIKWQIEETAEELRI
jgi:Zn finger protein HypA/HybF involved in hydrogenase expression